MWITPGVYFVKIHAIMTKGGKGSGKRCVRGGEGERLSYIYTRDSDYDTYWREDKRIYTWINDDSNLVQVKCEGRPRWPLIVSTTNSRLGVRVYDEIARRFEEITGENFWLGQQYYTGDYHLCSLCSSSYDSFAKPIRRKFIWIIKKILCNMGGEEVSQNWWLKRPDYDVIGCGVENVVEPRNYRPGHQRSSLPWEMTLDFDTLEIFVTLNSTTYRWAVCGWSQILSSLATTQIETIYPEGSQVPSSAATRVETTHITHPEMSLLLSTTTNF